MNQFNPLAFVTHGITPLGYAAFAFTLGVTAGALIRRTVPAMAVTLAIFAAVQIAMPLWIRPNLFPASHTTVAITSDSTLNLYTTDTPHTFTFSLATDDGLPGQPEAWIRSSGAADAAGHPVSTSRPIGLLASGEQQRARTRPRELPDQPGHPGRRHLPARQPVLALAVDRNRHLPRPVPRLAGYCFRRLAASPEKARQRGRFAGLWIPGLSLRQGSGYSVWSTQNSLSHGSRITQKSKPRLRRCVQATKGKPAVMALAGDCQAAPRSGRSGGEQHRFRSGARPTA